MKNKHIYGNYRNYIDETEHKLNVFCEYTETRQPSLVHYPCKWSCFFFCWGLTLVQCVCVRACVYVFACLVPCLQAKKSWGYGNGVKRTQKKSVPVCVCNTVCACMCVCCVRYVKNKYRQIILWNMASEKKNCKK